MKRTLLFVFMVIPLCALAIQDPDKTPEEGQMCDKRVYSRRNHKDPNWLHMHHYCDGLRFYQRAVGAKGRGDKNDLGFNIQNSLNNYDYVLKATSVDFDMRPEVLVMRGLTLELAGEGFEAAKHYNSALQLNPGFSMAYAALGNFYAKSGDKVQARKIYSEGLRRHPKNRYLRSRYKSVGGDFEAMQGTSATP